jgi:hypothetical protein
MFRLFAIFLALIVLLLAACTPQPAVPTEPPSERTPTTAATEASQQAAPTATEAPEPTPAETEILVDTEARADANTPSSLSFEAAAYRDETTGFELAYPVAWSLSSRQETGPRGSIAQLTEAGEPRLDIVVLLWDPKNDLSAFIDVRKQAWDASGFALSSEEEIMLAGDYEAASFEVESPEGERAFFFFTPVGERYLQLSGTGDLALLAEISRTVRILGSGESLDISASEPCLATEADPLDWVACNLIDGLRSRNLAALHGYMADPFALGYWASEFRSASPAEITTELAQYRLPADPASPMTFTTDRAKFPPLGGMPVEGMFGPDANIAEVIYSEGWAPDGAGAALLFLSQNDSGEYYWHGMVYSDGHFDR